jgi:hypothetical protein
MTMRLWRREAAKGKAAANQKITFTTPPLADRRQTSDTTVQERASPPIPRVPSIIPFDHTLLAFLYVLFHLELVFAFLHNQKRALKLP